MNKSLIQFLLEIRKSMDIQRYQRKHKLIPKNIAEHQWFVANIMMYLALYSNKENESANTGNLIEKGIYHEILTVWAGDIQGDIKREPNINNALDKVKKLIYKQKVQPLIPTKYKDIFNEILFNFNEQETKFLSYANKISKAIECYEEILLGNSEGYTDILNNKEKAEERRRKFAKGL